MSAKKKPVTLFAEAERACPAKLRPQIDHFAKTNFTRAMLDAVPSILMVLNEQRQVVYTNQALLDLLGVEDEQLLYGQRPGEMLGCSQALEAESGCGTGEACQTCGAVLATLAGLAGQSAVRECCITRTIEGQSELLSLRVWVTPLEFGQERFCIFAVTDISHEKRRRNLEKIFFHDVLNVAGSIRGFAEFLRDFDPEDKAAIFKLIHATSERIIEEIEAQRTLMAAETNELELCCELLSSRMVLGRVSQLFAHHDAVLERSLEIAADAEDVAFESDPVLIGRVLGNMVKNALEAARPGDTVTLGARRVGAMVEFWVHNPGAIKAQDQAQIFRRSFSTKGRSRGLGTYSMKLLSEKLCGQVGFESSEEGGTTFFARYPLQAD